MLRATTSTAALAALVLSLAALSACGPTGGSADSAASASAAGGSGSPAPSPGDASSAAPVPDGSVPPDTGVPGAAWIDPGDVPLNSVGHWPVPDGVAKAVHDPKFEFEDLCGAKRDPSNDLADWKGPAAEADLTAPGHGTKDWQARQTIVHFPGNDSAGQQLSFQLFTGLQSELNACRTTAPGATVRTTTTGSEGGDRDLAATVTLPARDGGGTTTLHTYLALSGRTLTELALWSQAGSPTWRAPGDRTVLNNLEKPVCKALGC